MSRHGRGRPASRLLVGAGISARAGALTGSGGGSGVLSVAPVLNLVNDPMFTGDDPMVPAGWTTSGFSLVSGAVVQSSAGQGVVSVSAIDNGANYAPTAIATFQAGVRYYARVDIATVFEAVPVEVVLGSTSDDYVSAQGTTPSNGSFLTLIVSWVPQVDRSATDHGLAVRAKSVPTGAFKWLILDNAIIATADGFWSGWRVGGKAASKPLTGTGGGSGTLGAGAATSGALTGTGGGSGSLSGRKGGVTAVTGTSGGNGTRTVTGAHTGAVTGTGGGAGTLAIASSNTYLPPGTLFGGGGRTGRSHTSHQIINQGIGALNQGVFARSGSLTGTGGGSGVLAGQRNGLASLTGTGGGSGGSLTIVKGARGTVTGTGGGAMVTQGAQTPTTGGIVATFVMGGGGRIGRSHPAIALVPAGRVQLAASSPDVRTGTLAGTGGGTGTFAGRKGGVTATPIEIPAPPPVFVQVLLVTGLRGTGGGSFTYAYTRSATRVGSITATAGGTGTFTATKKVSGALVGTGGGAPALTARRGATGTISGTGGGSFTYAYATFTAATGRLAASGGGSGTLTGNKKAAAALTGTAGGSLIPTARKGGRGAATGTGGGSFTYAYVRGGLAASGTVTGTGGGTGTLRAGKNVILVSTAGTGGGSGFFTAAKGAATTLAGHGGGTGTFLRATSTAPALTGRVNPRRRREGRVSEAELELPLILRR